MHSWAQLELELEKETLQLYLHLLYAFQNLGSWMTSIRCNYLLHVYKKNLFPNFQVSEGEKQEKQLT